MEGNYVKVENPPLITSALAAIDKPDGDIRLIHDLSRPFNSSVNDFATKDACEYQTLSDAINLLTPNSYMAKVDLKSAYRSVEIRHDHQILTGIQWTFSGDSKPTMLIDKCLPFGARKSPAAFNRITQSVKRMMERRGYKIIVYLDDFFMCEDTFEKCLQSFSTLISLLRSLNFRINWKKVIDPCKQLTFLGINIDLELGTLQLDPLKANSLCDHLKKIMVKKRLSKVQLQSLAGKLSWACQVTPWGRAHMAPFFQLISILKGANHKVRMTSTLLEEVEWWHAILSTSLNTKPIWDQRPSIVIATDACIVGGGAFCQGGSSLYVNWIIDKPELAEQHINIKELAMIKEAVCHSAPMLPDYHLAILTDNSASCYMINKGYSKNHVATALLKDIATIALQHNCFISAQFIPGSLNHIPDALSRLHQRGQWQRFVSIMNATKINYPVCHMSHLSYNFLFQLWQREYNSWIWK